MTEQFNAYHKWLGIPPKDQPPTHYRLLGIELFENDTDVIDAAANRVMSYLQELSVGEEAMAAQQLLNEISAARICLLTPQKKATYDGALRQNMAPAARPAAPLAAAPPPPMPSPPQIPQAAPQGFPPMAQPVAQQPAMAQPVMQSPVPSAPSPAPQPAFDAAATPTTTAGGPSILEKRRKDNTMIIWIVGGGITIAILVVAGIFASQSGNTGPGRIDPKEVRSDGGSKTNDLPALLIIEMKPTDRAGATIEINGQKKEIPASGQIQLFLPAGVQDIRITHPDHPPHIEKIGIGAGSEFSVRPNW